MAIEYFPCYHSYLARLAKLSDQEVGRLFRALLQYSATGECPELTGRESVAFDFIQFDIDQAHENFKERSRKNAENVQKRWNTNDTTEYDRIPSNTKDTKAKAKAKANTKANSISPPTPSWRMLLASLLVEYDFADALAGKIQDWADYKDSRKEGYKEQGMKALLTTIQKHALKYGDAAVINLIDLSMSNGWKGIIWDKLTESQRPVYAKKPEIPKGASGVLGDAELEAIQRVLRGD